MTRDEHDIKAPDGYLIGGLRKVRRDGTILFQRGWWRVPVKWAGEKVWIQECLIGNGVEVAPPGVGPFDCRYKTQDWFAAPETDRPVLAERTDRRDAKPGYRLKVHKDWHARATA